MKKISLFIITLFLFNCGRVEKQNASIVLKMPTFNKSDSSAFSDIGAMSGVVSDPATVADINCFALMVSGPEPLMQRTKCQIKDSADNVVGSISGGIIKGFVPSGGSIVVDVPPGSDRIFKLVGAQATPSSACLDFKDTNFTSDLISNVFVIAEASVSKIESGAEITLPMKLPVSTTAVNASAFPKVGDCSGPDNPGDGFKVVPTQVMISKNFFPNGIFRGQTSIQKCNSFYIDFVDSSGSRGEIASAISLDIKIDSRPTGGSFPGTYSAFTVYSSPDCSGPGVSSTALSIPAKTRSYQVNLKTDNIFTYDAFRFKISGLSNGWADYTQSGLFPNLNETSTYSIAEFGTRNILPNTCYVMKGLIKSLGGNIATPIVGGYNYTVDLPSSLQVYDSANCTNPISNGSYSSGVDSIFNYSVKSIASPGSWTTYGLKPVSGTPTNVMNYVVVNVGGGTSTASRLFMDMFTNMPIGSCVGPFRANVTNERGTSIPVGTGTIYMTSSNSNLQLSTTSTCAVYNLNQSFNVTSGDYGIDYYIKTLSTSGTYTLSATYTSGPTTLSTSQAVNVGTGF